MIPAARVRPPTPPSPPRLPPLLYVCSSRRRTAIPPSSTPTVSGLLPFREIEISLNSPRDCVRPSPLPAPVLPTTAFSAVFTFVDLSASAQLRFTYSAKKREKGKVTRFQAAESRIFRFSSRECSSLVSDFRASFFHFRGGGEGGREEVFAPRMTRARVDTLSTAGIDLLDALISYLAYDFEHAISYLCLRARRNPREMDYTKYNSLRSVVGR